jgi:WW domain-containing oxidoreductase
MLSGSAHKFAPKSGIEFDNLSGEKGYSAWRAYGQSKMANLLFAKELARRFGGTTRTANALHPGVIFDTNLQRSMKVPRVVRDSVVGLSNLFVLKSIPQGAATQCYVATNPAIGAVSRYFKTLRGLTPYEFICKAWTSERHRFKINPLQQMPGLNS